MDSGYATLLFQLRKKVLKIDNKYENMDIIELENPEDIVESFIDCACEADLHGKTVAIIANKDLVLHAMNEVMEYDVFNIRRVDIEMNDIEYMISIDKDSNLVVQPVEYYKDKFFEDIDIAYISMDGDICQITIDRLINSDKDVILFGLEDEDSCDGDCEDCELHELENKNQSDSDEMLGFSYSFDNTMGSTHVSFYSTDKNLVEKMAKLYME